MSSRLWECETLKSFGFPLSLAEGVSPKVNKGTGVVRWVGLLCLWVWGLLPGSPNRGVGGASSFQVDPTSNNKSAHAVKLSPNKRPTPTTCFFCTLGAELQKAAIPPSKHKKEVSHPAVIDPTADTTSRELRATTVSIVPSTSDQLRPSLPHAVLSQTCLARPLCHYRLGADGSDRLGAAGLPRGRRVCRRRAVPPSSQVTQPACGQAGLDTAIQGRRCPTPKRA